MSCALQCKLSVVTAPPGFGKTTLVSEWVRLGGTRACWVSLDKGENDVLRFWSYVIAAFDRLEPGIGKKALSLLESPLHISIEQMISWLVNDLFEMSDDIVLIMDDYHAIDLEDVHRSIEYLLERLPKQVHLCLISRKSPPFPVGTLRAKGQLNEIDISDLRFTAP
jgi:LuxR family maltose regulon positive regulatory protein